MKTLNTVQLALVSTLVAATFACGVDQPLDNDGFGPSGEDEVSFRCSGGPGCIGLNTPIIGEFEVSNIATLWESPFTHASRDIETEIYLANKLIGGSHVNMVDWSITDNNEIQFAYLDVQGVKVWLKGTAVTGVNVFLQITVPSTGVTQHHGITITKVQLPSSSNTTPLYDVGTTTEPDDTQTFISFDAENSEGDELYAVCQKDLNIVYDGFFNERTVVFSKSTENDTTKPQVVHSNSSVISLFCGQGAMAHGITDPYIADVRYGAGLQGTTRDTNSDDLSNAVINAIRAYYDGDSHTTVGNPIRLEDKSGSGLFSIPQGWARDSDVAAHGMLCHTSDARSWLSAVGLATCGPSQTLGTVVVAAVKP